MTSQESLRALAGQRPGSNPSRWIVMFKSGDLPGTPGRRGRGDEALGVDPYEMEWGTNPC